MSEELPRSPFRQSENLEKTSLTEEVRAVLGIFKLTQRLRAKNPDDPNDVDKSPDDIEESVGDDVAMTAYLVHYFLPLLEQSGEKLNYERILDMVLANEVGNIGDIQDVPGVQKTPEAKQQEIIATAKLFGTLPRRNGFNRALFDAYAEYIEQKTKEARLVRAVKGLSTMLYILSRPEVTKSKEPGEERNLRKELVAGNGYALKDYKNRIGKFCEQFEPLGEFYALIERFFHARGYFAKSRKYENGIMRPGVMKSALISNAPDFGNPNDLDIDAENEGLLKFFRLRRKLRFGQGMKPAHEHHDTVAEHTANLLVFERYFGPAIMGDPEQEGRDRISIRGGSEILLSHDVIEILTGEKIAQIKTEKDAVDEKDAAGAIVRNYGPRASNFNILFGQRYAEYESGKTPPLAVSNPTLAKAEDVLEGQFGIFDPETREKLPYMHIMSRREVDEKAGGFIRLYPILNAHYEALNRKFEEAGIF